MKHGVTVLMVLVVAASAFAGKAERDKMNNDVLPHVHDAEAKFKTSCGCALDIKVDETTVKTTEDMHCIIGTAEDISSYVGKYCSDAPSKAAVCKMKTLTLAKGKESTFTFKGSSGLAVTDGQGCVTFSMMTRELDK